MPIDNGLPGLPYLLLVLLGGGLGAMARLALVRSAARGWSAAWPWGIWAANISGALAAGVVLALIGGFPELPGRLLWWLLLVGFLGSLTTVSSFSLQTLLLFRERGTGAALINLLVSVGGCLTATTLGFLAVSLMLMNGGGGL
ncbi:MAG: CrcB family protein [Alcanivorax sp.]|nr:CrcB family protein [Alcanivorax sp.]